MDGFDNLGADEVGFDYGSLFQVASGGCAFGEEIVMSYRVWQSNGAFAGSFPDEKSAVAYRKVY